MQIPTRGMYNKNNNTFTSNTTRCLIKCIFFIFSPVLVVAYASAFLYDSLPLAYILVPCILGAWPIIPGIWYTNTYPAYNKLQSSALNRIPILYRYPRTFPPSGKMKKKSTDMNLNNCANIHIVSLSLLFVYVCVYVCICVYTGLSSNQLWWPHPLNNACTHVSIRNDRGTTHSSRNNAMSSCG
jgi:hypothetical protein